MRCFNSQPLEGGCRPLRHLRPCRGVSTHSRSKAAAPGCARPSRSRCNRVSTHSRSKAAAQYSFTAGARHDVSTHSRSKAAAWQASAQCGHLQSFNSQPLEGGCRRNHAGAAPWSGFNSQPLEGGCGLFTPCKKPANCFNSQPLEGGCQNRYFMINSKTWFQLTAARRRLP